jgi:hypothetical protein
VIPIDDKQAQSLEFKSNANFLLEKLRTKGFQPVDDPSKARFIAFLTYGIDEGRTLQSSVPIYGQVNSGGSSYTSGTVYSGGQSASFSSNTYKMPQYGVVGTQSYSTTSYKREVNIDIYAADVNPPAKVFEVRTTSSGACGNISAVVKPIIDGAMQAFPGEAGKSAKVMVTADGRC